MKLVNVNTLQLHNFSASKPPPYVALSHRWTGDETTYEDFIDPNRKPSPGLEKVEQACRFVASLAGRDNADPIEWLWVDTCSIDKRSSAELSEAINSMAAWYHECAYCLAYLVDVPAISAGEDAVMEAFDRSEWFRRGWCLQELLFPFQIIFCNKEWEQIGLKRAMPLPTPGGPPSLSGRICKITNIPKPVLYDTRLIFQQSVARRMSWAAKRVTTRPEDAAYSLLGLFRINMPLLYGEGNNAFQRLQKEIIASSDDESIFAWSSGSFKWRERWSLLANYPSQFFNCGDIHRIQLVKRPLYRITNQYLEFQSKAIRLGLPNGSLYLVELNCCVIPDLPVYSNFGNDGSLAQEMSSQPGNTCLIALHEAQDGRFRRVLHGGGGMDLVAHVKRICPRATISVVEDISFTIVLTNALKESAVMLQPESFPALVRLESLFDVSAERTTDNEVGDESLDLVRPLANPLEDEWY